MIKHTLRECFSLSDTSEVFSESERFSDWQIRFDYDHWRAWDWLFSYNKSSSLGNHLVDPSDDLVRRLDFTEENWLHEPWLGCKLTGINDPPSRWNDLATSSVNGVRYQLGIHDVDSHAS